MLTVRMTFTANTTANMVGRLTGTGRVAATEYSGITRHAGFGCINHDLFGFDDVALALEPSFTIFGQKGSSAPPCDKGRYRRACPR